MWKSRSPLVRFFIGLSVLAASAPALFAHGTAAAHGHALTVGDGTAASCTEWAVRQALSVAAASGGRTIRFRCGDDPLAISLTELAEVRDIGPVLIVAPENTTIDGGGVITLAGLVDGV